MRALTVALALLVASEASAQTLTVGLKTEMNGLDPHLMNAPAGHQINRHMFDRLVQFAGGGIEPGLAASWQQRDDTTLVLMLRPGVTFHDGTPVTAGDVAASLARIPSVPANIGAFLPYIRAVTAVETPDPATVVLRSAAPSPSLLRNLALVSVVPAKHAQAAPEAFNAGSAAVGSGPYRFVRYARSEVLELERNDAWWGPKPEWQRVRLRFIPNDGARLAGLLSGELDLVNSLATQDATTMQADSRVQVFQAASFRVVHFSFDLAREQPNHVTGNDGQPMRNPFRDLKVRQAISGAIQRGPIAERLMGGFARPATQLASAETFGFAPDIASPERDVAAARVLLAEAGHPQGFQMVIHAPSDFIPNGPAIAQAAAQQLARIGIRASVSTSPSSVHFPATRRPEGPEWSFWMTSWGNNGGDSIDALQALLHTPDRERALGAQNVARGSVPEADALIRAALVELDDARRQAMQQQAMRLLMAEVMQVPLLVQTALFAGRRGIAYTPNPQDHFHAHEVRTTR
jgi:peptide/nickel transport system substrate-binding protein